MLGAIGDQRAEMTPTEDLRKFLASDLSRLKKRYDALFTERLAWTKDGGIQHEPGSLDAEMQRWADESEIPPLVPNIIRSQPEENARRVFHDLKSIIANVPEDLNGPRLAAASFKTHGFDWMPALIAIVEVLNPKRSLGWIFESLQMNWGSELAAQWMHTCFPREFFPISTELLWKPDRLQRYCEGLEVSVTWPSPDRSAVSAFLDVNDAIRDWANDYNLDPWQVWAVFFHLAPRLFPDPEPATSKPSTWVIPSSEASYPGLERQDEETQYWTANRQTRCGDIVFVYCLAPRKAITHRYRAACDAVVNPFLDHWTKDRIWVELTDRESLPWITLDEMRTDPVLSSWAAVRTSFQGTRRQRVSESIASRLNELITAKLRAGQVPPSMTASIEVSSTAVIPASPETIRVLQEREFEDRTVCPLLQRLGWSQNDRVIRQLSLYMYVGSRRVINRADFVLYADSDRQEPLAVIEAKRSIRNDEDLQAARLQAESYAGYLRVEIFAVVAPEGFWLYRLRFPVQSEEVARHTLAELSTDSIIQRLRSLLALSSPELARQESPLVVGLPQ